MPDIEITYCSSVITSFSSGGTEILETAGTFLEDDIAIQYSPPAGGPSGMYVEYDGNYVKNIAINSATSIPKYFIHSQTLSSPFSITGFSEVTNIASSAFFYLSGGANVVPVDINCPALSFVGTSAFTNCDWIKSFSASQLSSAYSAAFSGCTNLSSVNFPALSIFSQYLFANTGFTELTLSKGTIENSVFASCRKLLSVSLANCTTIQSGAFNDCTSLENVYIPSVSVMWGSVFLGCTNLSTINLPNVTNFGSVAGNANGGQFSGCTKLKEVSAPMLKSILGPGAFNGCRSLTSVFLPELSVLSGASTFNNCNNLESISLPKLSSIVGSCVFTYCSALTSMTFPYVSSTGSVYASYWFSNCYNLSLVSFKNIKTLMGLGAFSRCYHLISLFMMGSSLTELGNTIASMFSSTPVSTYSTSAGRWASIFVPSSLLASYKAATNWTTVSSKIFAYEDYFDAEGNPK